MKADPTNAQVQISGMTCSNCVRHVREAIEAVPTVASAEVSLDTARAIVKWRNPGESDLKPVLHAIQEAGYDANIATPDVSKRSSWLTGWHFNVVLGSLATIPMMVCEWFLGLGMEPWYRWSSFALSALVQILAGARFYLGAWLQLKRGSSNMDTLVVLGSTTAFAYSAFLLLSGGHGHLFFMESASIITLISVGHWLEAKVAARAESSLRALLALAPEQARKLDENGSEHMVPVASLKLGDVLVIKPGDRIPTDAVVLRGKSAVDESLLTGESMPVEKADGATVLGGTMNVDGQLEAKVSAVGEAIALARITALIQEAQNSRAQIQNLADRISNIFVPIVVLVAFATAVFWGFWPDLAAQFSAGLQPFLWKTHFEGTPAALAVYHTASVLIIACPCAMGLATPIAIIAGTNAAARRGILIRNGAALEKSGSINTVLFDKTGTLTAGRIQVVATFAATGLESELQNLASSLARPSNHPISRAIAKASTSTGSWETWSELRGLGVTATAHQETWRLGSLPWLKDSKIDLTPAAIFVEEWSRQGATVIGLARGPLLLGVFALRDQLKPGARDVVIRLSRAGKAVYLVSGDQKRAAEAIGKELGIPTSNVLSEVRPEGKQALIRKLQGEGAKVAFVGDGINDAPALEQADLGIAVSQAADVARAAADIVLLNADVQTIPGSLAIAEATLRTIKQNLFWAFFYNIVGIPLAALGFMTPILCAAAMGLSDLVVIGNALRLNRFATKPD